MKWLNNNKVLRNFFTVVVWIVAYGAAIVWFGLFKDLDLDTVVLVDTGALTIIGFIAIKSLRWDITQRGFIDENVNNLDLVEVNDGIVFENKAIEDDEVGQLYVDGYNKRKQEKADKELTDHKLSKLRKKLRTIRIKTKIPFFKRLFTKLDFIEYQKTIIDKYTTQISLLETNPVFNKKYKAVKYEDIIHVGDLITKKVIPEHKKFKYDPRKDAWWSWFFSIFKFVGIGATSIPFAINRQDWGILAAFYIALTITALITVIRRYLGIRKRTGGPYLQYRRDKWNFMKAINKFIVTTTALLEIKKNKEDTDKGLILKKDKDVIFTTDGDAYMIHRIEFVNPMQSRGKYGYGKTYMEAYDNMIIEQRNENAMVDFLLVLKEKLKYKKDEFVHTFVDGSMGYTTVEALNSRLEEHKYTAKSVIDHFGRKPTIMRIKKN